MTDKDPPSLSEKTEIKKTKNKNTLCFRTRDSKIIYVLWKSILYVEHETSYVACREEECEKCATVCVCLVVYSLND